MYLKIKKYINRCTLSYVPCFRHFDVCYVCLGGGCGDLGGACGKECCRELLEEGGYLWCGGCVEVSRGSLLL